MERKLALFIDFENIARGVRQRHLEERVDLRAILAELEGKGRILIKRAYADWGYFKDYRSDLLQQGIEPVQVFAASRDREGWKNGADIRIAVDAVETAFRLPDITDFVLVSGDSDFLSLVSRLRENGKMVSGIGLKTSSSQYLVQSCDFFTFYEDITDWVSDGSPEVRRDSRTLLLTTIRRMADRQGLPGMPPPGTPLKAGAVRAAMRRMDPAWDEQFEGYSTFQDFLEAHSDAVLIRRLTESVEPFIAERGTVMEANLQRMSEQAQIEPVGEPLPEQELLIALVRALRTLGNPDHGVDQAQKVAVKGTALRQKLKQDITGFDESQYGYTNFVDFLLNLREHVRVARGEARGDVLVAEKASPADASLAALPDAAPGTPLVGSFVYSSPSAASPSNGWVQTPEQKYLGALRIRRIRYVPAAERYAITRNLHRIFDEAITAGEDISLKEAKDRLHHWYEENEPSVPWENVNNTVYHLFWTYCFEFGEPSDHSEETALWDRSTRWQVGLATPEDVIRKCDTAMVRMISEVVGQVDPKLVLEVLGDGVEERLPYFEEICATVNSRFSGGVRSY